jgi:hypothetical protein
MNNIKNPIINVVIGKSPLKIFFAILIIYTLILF